MNVHDIEASNTGVYVTNWAAGATDITVNGQITISGTVGYHPVGVLALGADTKITVASGADVTSSNIGIQTDNYAYTNDTITVNGSVAGLYKAIWLVAGDDTVNLGPEARISGIIDDGSGSDIANFSANRTSLYNFTYNETTKASVVQIDGKAITFKDFELFKFLDDTSATNASEMASNFTSHTVEAVVLSQDGSEVSGSDVVMRDGPNSFSYKTVDDGSVSGALNSGSSPSVTASVAYSQSVGAVTSQDALDALKLSVGLSTSQGTKTAFDFMSADFNQDGKVSSQDALAILKYSVGLPTSEEAKWVFVDTNGDYSGVSKSNTSYTEGVSIADLSADTFVSLTGILIGDVNDSYSGLIA